MDSNNEKLKNTSNSYIVSSRSNIVNIPGGSEVSEQDPVLEQIRKSRI